MRRFICTCLKVGQQLYEKTNGMEPHEIIDSGCIKFVKRNLAEDDHRTPLWLSLTNCSWSRHPQPTLQTFTLDNHQKQHTYSQLSRPSPSTTSRSNTYIAPCSKRQGNLTHPRERVCTLGEVKQDQEPRLPASKL